MASDPVISKTQVEEFRASTYHTKPGHQIHTKHDAVKFVNERGFVFFWPITDIQMPSLWCAAAGDRPVPNNHDDPGHKTWGWKDDLLGKKKWYYAKVLRRKSTIISLDLIPNFFTLTPSVHDGIEEVNFHYKNGLLSAEEKFVFQQLTDFGPLDSITLRKKFSVLFGNNESRFNRALDLLQRDFRITPSGISHNGRWKYAYVYEIVSREFPEFIEQSKKLSKSEAAQLIISSYLQSNGFGTEAEIKKLFGWQDKIIDNTISSLLANKIIGRASLEWDNGKEVYVVAELI